MLNLRKGSTVPFPEQLSEGYELIDNRILANVDADHIESVLTHFIHMHKEPLFFILEIPTNQNDEPLLPPNTSESFHKDVYYIDGCSQEKATAVFSRIRAVLLNDGMCSFGFGCHETHDEIMFCKYNVAEIYSQDICKFNGFYEQHSIHQVKELKTAWDTFTQDCLGESSRIDTGDISIYDIPQILSDDGIYFAERRED